MGELMGIQSGRLDTKIAIKAPTVTQDSTGAPTTTYTDISHGPTWAQYIPLRGEERALAGQLSEVTDFKLRIRRDSRVDSTHRVTVDSVDCEILGVEDNRRQGDMVLHCRKVA
jgi:SPP1 family predicted phage head-tail adaptor